MQRYPKLGDGVSDSSYEKIGLAVDVVVASFRDKLCKAIEGSGGRLDGIVDAVVHFGRIADLQRTTELTTLDAISDESPDEALGIYSELFLREKIYGMELGISVSFVRRKRGKTDEQMFEEMFGKGIDKASAEARLVAVYNGGGTVNLDSADSQAVIAWLKRELPKLIVKGMPKEDSAERLARESEGEYAPR